MCSRAAHGGGSPSIQKERLTAELSATHSAPRQLHPAAESTASPAHIHWQRAGTARAGRTHQGLRNHREERSWQRRVDIGAMLSPSHKKLLPVTSLCLNCSNISLTSLQTSAGLKIVFKNISKILPQ